MPYALDDAAAAALWRLRLEPQEHMAALYGQDEIGTSNAVTTGSDGKVKGQLRVPTGSLRALIHNHPSQGTEAAKFSDVDKAQARRLQIPSYITTPDGRVRVFEPGPNGVRDVLAQFPVEEIRRLYMAEGLKK